MGHGEFTNCQTPFHTSLKYYNSNTRPAKNPLDPSRDPITATQQVRCLFMTSREGKALTTWAGGLRRLVRMATQTWPLCLLETRATWSTEEPWAPRRVSSSHRRTDSSFSRLPPSLPPTLRRYGSTFHLLYTTTALIFNCSFDLIQAFIKTADNIYEKIKDGLYDPSREGNGVKLGVMAAAPKAAAKSGGCC